MITPSHHFNVVAYLVIAFFICLIQVDAVSQTVTVHGRVSSMSPSGENLGFVANAKIEFTDRDGSKVADAKSDEKGYYHMNSVPVGTMGYSLVAEGHQTAFGRQIKVSKQKDIQTVDFVLVTGTKPSRDGMGTVNVTLKSNAAQEDELARQKILNAQVWARNIDTKKLIQSNRDSSASNLHQLILPTGVWKIVAVPETGSPMHFTKPVQVAEDQEYSIEFEFSGTESQVAQNVFALVAVKKSNETDPDQQPTVKFVSDQPNLQPIIADLNPVSPEDLAHLGSSDKEDSPVNWRWYWAESKSTLPAGRFATYAQLTGTDSAKTAFQTVNSSTAPIFHLSLFPSDQLAELTGFVSLESGDGSNQLLGNSNVVAVNQKNRQSRQTKCDEQGRYRFELPPGEWWISATRSAEDAAPINDSDDNGVTTSAPVSVKVTPLGTFEHNITFTRLSSIKEEIQHYAILHVTNLADPKGVSPRIEFVSETDGSKTPAEVKALTADQLTELGLESSDSLQSKNRWFIATPQSNLVPGVYHAVASAESFGSNASSTHSVRNDASTYFHVALTQTNQPGSLNVTVRPTLQSANVSEARVFAANSNRRLQLEKKSDGEYFSDELPPGTWWVSVEARGFRKQPARPLLVESEKTAKAKFTLQPYPPGKTKGQMVGIVATEQPVGEPPIIDILHQLTGGEIRSGVQTQAISSRSAARYLSSDQADPRMSFFLFQIDELPVGQYSAVVSAELHRPARSEPVMILPGLTGQCFVKLFSLSENQKGAEIHGRIFGQSREGDPAGWVANALITFRTKEGLITAKAESDSNGYYHVANVAPGEIRYSVRATGYRSEDSKRAIEVVPGERPTVVNFTLTEGGSNPSNSSHLKIDVKSIDVHGTKNRVPNVTLTIWKEGRENQRRYLPLPENQGKSMKLAAGKFWVSAKAPGYEPSVALPINLNDEQLIRKEIILNQLVEDARALIRVKRDESVKAKPDENVRPRAWLISASGDFRLELQVDPLATEELQEIQPDSSTGDLWFWGTLTSTVSRGDYVVESTIKGYPNGHSSIHSLVHGETTLFHVDHVQAARLHQLTGTITAEGTPTPIPNCVLEIENANSGSRIRIRSNDAGAYTVSLKPGKYWASVQPPKSRTNLLSLPPQLVDLSRAAQTVTRDFQLAARPKQPSDSRVAVSVLLHVNGTPSDNQLPQVVFFTGSNSMVAANNIAAMNEEARKTYGIPEAESNWYLATTQLKPGEVFARAQLKGFQVAETPTQNASVGSETVLLINLKPMPQAFSSLRSKVSVEGEDDVKIERALFTLENEFGKRIQKWSVGDTCNFSRVEPGFWWVTASAVGFKLKQPRMIQVETQSRKRVDLTLTRCKPKTAAPNVIATLTFTDHDQCSSTTSVPVATLVKVAGEDELQTWRVRISTDRLIMEEIKRSRTIQEVDSRTGQPVTKTVLYSVLVPRLVNRDSHRDLLIDFEPGDIFEPADTLPSMEDQRLHQTVPQLADISKTLLEEKLERKLNVRSVKRSRYNPADGTFDLLLEVEGVVKLPARVQLLQAGATTRIYSARIEGQVDNGRWVLESQMGEQLMRSDVHEVLAGQTTVYEIKYEIEPQLNATMFTAWDDSKFTVDNDRQLLQLIENQSQKESELDSPPLPSAPTNSAPLAPAAANPGPETSGGTDGTSSGSDDSKQLARLKKKTIPNATFVVIGDKQGTYSNPIKPFQLRFLPPGKYWIKAFAPGYQSSQLKKVSVDCQGSLLHTFRLKRSPQKTSNRSQLVALIRVDSKESAEEPVIWANQARRSFFVSSSVPIGPKRELPMLSFNRLESGSIVGRSIATRVREIDLSTARKIGANHLSNHNGETDSRWFVAEAAADVSPGTYQAKATYQDFGERISVAKTAQPNSVSVFNIVFGESKDLDLAASLTLDIHSSTNEAAPILGARVMIRNADTGEIRQMKNSTRESLKIELPSGKWKLAVEAKDYRKYKHVDVLDLSPGINEHMAIQLEPKPTEELKSNSIQFLVALPKSAAFPKLTVDLEFRIPKAHFENYQEQYTENGTTKTRLRRVEKIRHEMLVSRFSNFRRLSAGELSKQGITQQRFPREQWQWFIGRMAEGVPASGQVKASIKLDGIGHARSPMKRLRESGTSSIDLIVQTARPQMDLTFVDQDEAPLKDAAVSVWHKDASFAKAIQLTTDNQGVVRTRLAAPGEYRILTRKESKTLSTETVTVTADDFSKRFKVDVSEPKPRVFGGKVLSKDLNRPIEDATVSIHDGSQRLRKRVSTSRDGSFRMESVQNGDYTMTVVAKDFSCWKELVSIDEKLTPVSVVLESRNVDAERAIRRLLTDGWQNADSAQRHYDEAVRADPKHPLADYALGLVHGNAKQLEKASQAFGQAIRKRHPQFVWDRAADARFWSDLNSSQEARAFREMRAISAIYKDRHPNHASVENAKWIGTCLELAQGPLSHVMAPADLAATRSAIENNLNSEHRQAYETGCRFGGSLIENPKSGDVAQGKLDQIRAQELELNRQLAQVGTKIQNAISNHQAETRDFQTQIQRLQESFQPDKKELESKTQHRESLKANLNRLKASGQENSKAAADLSREILETSLRISQLKKKKIAFDSQITTITSKQKSAEADLKARLLPLNNQKSKLQKSLQQIAPAPTSKQTPISHFRDFPWEERRAEILETVTREGDEKEDQTPKKTAQIEEPKSKRNIEPKTNIGDLVDQGKVFLENEKWSDAERIFREALRLDPNHAQALTYLGGTLHSQYTHHLTSDLAEPLHVLDRAVGMDPKSGTAFRFRGWVQMDKGDPEKARSDFDAARKLDPKDAEACLGSGIANFYLERGSEAVNDLNRAISLKIEDPRAYHYRGVIFHRQGNLRRAYTDLSNAIRLNPKDPTFFLDRGHLQRDTGNLAQAISDFGKAVQLDKDLFAAWLERGHLYMETNQPRLAATNYSHAIRLNPECIDAHYGRGRAYQANGDYKRADEDLTKVIFEVERDRADLKAAAYAQRAMVKYRTQKFNGCVADAKQSIALNPKLGLAYRMLAIGSMKQREFMTAIGALNQALEIDPNDFVALQNRYRCHVELNDLPSALADVNQGLRIRPGDRQLATLKAQIEAHMLGPKQQGSKKQGSYGKSGASGGGGFF